MPVRVVGPGGPPKYATITAALQGFSGSPSDRGTIIVEPGLYNERVTDNVSHVDVVAKVPGSVIVSRFEPPDPITSGGTYNIAAVADSNNPVIDKLLYGLRIIRNVTGLGGDPPQFGGGPPEAALYVGQEVGSGFPEELYWDDITIKNCIVEGVHDGIQCFGQGTPTSTPHPAVGQVLIQDCIIRSAHDALTLKGNMRMISKNNYIRVDSRGIAPYLTNIAAWKSTGFHMNTRRIVTERAPVRVAA